MTMHIDMQPRATQDEVDADFDRICANLEVQGFQYWFTDYHKTYYKHVDTDEHAIITTP